MNVRAESWRVEEGMVCADPSPDDKPPYGDVVALAPSCQKGDAFHLSEYLWPERSARLVAAVNALRGYEVDEFVQLVEDALAFRALSTAEGMPGLDEMREEYQQFKIETLNQESEL
jgi:hypothetical protein